MWPFNKKSSIIEAGVLQGFTDWHTHLLPGVDDGFKKMEDSLAALKRYEELGVSKVWLTPHVMEDYPNTPEMLKARFAELKDAYKGTIILKLAAENMLDPLFDERLQNNEVLPIGDNGQYLLVETSYFNPPYSMDGMIESVFSAGYTPLLAHPERYGYMSEKDYHKWRERGVLFQLNYFSLAGGYGELAKKKAEWLIKNGMIDVCGSDVHRLGFFESCVSKPIKSSSVRAFESITANREQSAGML